MSRALGYESNGSMYATRPGGTANMLRYLLTRERWERSQRDDIVITGLAECLPVLGL